MTHVYILRCQCAPVRITDHLQRVAIEVATMAGRESAVARGFAIAT
jgi:hypothetical protein